jgi:hypothetical protein
MSIPPNSSFKNVTNEKTMKVTNLTVKNALSFFGVPLAEQQDVISTSGSINNLLKKFGFVYPQLWSRQTNALSGSGNSTNSLQGSSTALSSDGNTVVIGGPGNSSDSGAIWIFTRVGTAWSQQAGPLAGFGIIGAAKLGTSVSISDDGNTVVVGGPGQNGNIGAIWIYTRSGVSWSLQAGPLVGTDYIGSSLQGTSVSISGDGNTVVVGGPGHIDSIGAIWIYTRVGTVWSQHNIEPIIGTDAIGSSLQGTSVSISGDGNTIAVGGPGNDLDKGATWIFVKTEIDNEIVWIQQVSSMTISTMADAKQGTSVALSENGNNLIVGAPYSYDTGSSSIYIRNGNSWIVQEKILTGEDLTVYARQGSSVTMSGSGEIAISGAPYNHSNLGGAIPFKYENNKWSQESVLIISASSVGYTSQGYSVSISRDGTTMSIGGPNNVNRFGAVWIFVHV